MATVTVSENAGLQTGVALAILIFAIFSSWLFAALSRGRASLIVPRLKLIFHNYEKNKQLIAAFFCCNLSVDDIGDLQDQERVEEDSDNEEGNEGEQDEETGQINPYTPVTKEEEATSCCHPMYLETFFVYACQILVYALMLMVLAGLITMTIVSDMYYTDSGTITANIFIIGAFVWANLLLFFVSMYTKWERVYVLHHFLSYLIIGLFIAFIILNLYGTSDLSSALSYRASGALWVTLSVLPLYFFDGEGLDDGKQVGDTAANKVYPVNFLGLNPPPQRAMWKIIKHLFDDCCLTTIVDLGDLRSANGVMEGDGKGGSKMSKEDDDEDHADKDSFADQCQRCIRSFKISLKKCFKCIRRQIDFETDVPKDYWLWLLSVTPLLVFAIVTHYNLDNTDNINTNAKSAPILIFVVAIINELTLTSLVSTTSMLFIILIISRYMMVLAGSHFWLLGVVSVLLYSASLQLNQIITFYLPEPEKKAAIIYTAMETLAEKEKEIEMELIKEKEKLARALHDANVTAKDEVIDEDASIVDLDKIDGETIVIASRSPKSRSNSALDAPMVSPSSRTSIGSRASIRVSISDTLTPSSERRDSMNARKSFSAHGAKLSSNLDQIDLMHKKEDDKRHSLLSYTRSSISESTTSRVSRRDSADSTSPDPRERNVSGSSMRISSSSITSSVPTQDDRKHHEHHELNVYDDDEGEKVSGVGIVNTMAISNMADVVKQQHFIAISQHRKERHDREVARKLNKAKQKTTFQNQAFSLLVGQVMIGILIIIGYNDVVNLELYVIYNKTQAAWAGLLWLTWFAYFMTLLVRHSILCGGFGSIMKIYESVFSTYDIDRLADDINDDTDDDSTHTDSQVNGDNEGKDDNFNFDIVGGKRTFNAFQGYFRRLQEKEGKEPSLFDQMNSPEHVEEDNGEASAFPVVIHSIQSISLYQCCTGLLGSLIQFSVCITTCWIPGTDIPAWYEGHIRRSKRNWWKHSCIGSSLGAFLITCSDTVSPGLEEPIMVGFFVAFDWVILVSSAVLAGYLFNEWIVVPLTALIPLAIFTFLNWIQEWENNNCPGYDFEALKGIPSQLYNSVLYCRRRILVPRRRILKEMNRRDIEAKKLAMLTESPDKPSLQLTFETQGEKGGNSGRHPEEGRSRASSISSHASDSSNLSGSTLDGDRDCCRATWCSCDTDMDEYNTDTELFRMQNEADVGSEQIDCECDCDCSCTQNADKAVISTQPQAGDSTDGVDSSVRANLAADALNKEDNGDDDEDDRMAAINMNDMYVPDDADCGAKCQACGRNCNKSCCICCDNFGTSLVTYCNTPCCELFYMIFIAPFVIAYRLFFTVCDYCSISYNWIFKRNSFQFAMFILICAVSLTSMFNNYWVALYICLWLLSTFVTMMCITRWRTTLEFNNDVKLLLFVSWIPTLIWAIVAGTGTSDLTQNETAALCIILLLGATATQLCILTYLAWGDIKICASASRHDAAIADRKAALSRDEQDNKDGNNDAESDEDEVEGDDESVESGTNSTTDTTTIDNNWDSAPTWTGAGSAWLKQGTSNYDLEVLENGEKKKSRHLVTTSAASVAQKKNEKKLIISCCACCTTSINFVIIYPDEGKEFLLKMITTSFVLYLACVISFIVYVSVPLGVGFLLLLIAVFIRVIYILGLFNYSFNGNNTEYATKLPQWISRILYSIAPLIILLSGLLGAIMYPDNGFLWISFGWLGMACGILAKGVYEERYGVRKSYSTAYFPVFKLDPVQHVKEASFESSYVLMFIVMVLIWSLWASVMIQPSEIGIITFTIGCASVALYSKFVSEGGVNDSISKEINGEILSSAVDQALKELYIYESNEPINFDERNRNDDDDNDDGSGYEKGKVAPERHRSNLEQIERFVDSRDALSDRFRQLIRHYCRNALSQWPFLNFLLGYCSEELYTSKMWNDTITQRCEAIYDMHEELIDASYQLSKLNALVHLKSCSIASNRLKMRENLLIHFLRTETEFRDITVEGLRNFPYMLVSELMERFRVFSKFKEELSIERCRKREAQEEAERIRNSKRTAFIQKKRAELYQAAEERRREREQLKREEEERKRLEREEQQRELEESRRREKERELEHEEEVRRLKEELRLMEERALALENEKKEEEQKNREEQEERNRLERRKAEEAKEQLRREEEEEQRRKDEFRRQEEERKLELQRQAEEEKRQEKEREATKQANVKSVVTAYGVEVSDDLDEYRDALLSGVGKGSFVDHDFELMAALGEGEDHFTSPTFGNGHGMAFKRATNIVKDNLKAKLDDHAMPKAYNGRVDPVSVHQGCLGDCYLLSAIANISERPHLVRNIIHYADHKKGLYVVRLYFNGKFRYICLDNFFPVINPPRDGKRYQVQVAFQQLNDSTQFWVAIIEKAYAKLHGSYQNISGGFEDQAMADLTGKPIFIFCFLFLLPFSLS